MLSTGINVRTVKNSTKLSCILLKLSRKLLFTGSSTYICGWSNTRNAKFIAITWTLIFYYANHIYLLEGWIRIFSIQQKHKFWSLIHPTCLSFSKLSPKFCNEPTKIGYFQNSESIFEIKYVRSDRSYALAELLCCKFCSSGCAQSLRCVHPCT